MDRRSSLASGWPRASSRWSTRIYVHIPRASKQSTLPIETIRRPCVRRETSQFGRGVVGGWGGTDSTRHPRPFAAVVGAVGRAAAMVNSAGKSAPYISIGARGLGRAANDQLLFFFLLFLPRPARGESAPLHIAGRQGHRATTAGRAYTSCCVLCVSRCRPKQPIKSGWTL